MHSIKYAFCLTKKELVALSLHGFLKISAKSLPWKKSQDYCQYWNLYLSRSPLCVCYWHSAAVVTYTLLGQA